MPGPIGQQACFIRDGERYFVPRPFLISDPDFKDGKCKRVEKTLSYGHDVDDLIAAIGNCEDSAAVMSGVATVAAALLRFNYDLSEDELDQLLVLRAGVPAKDDWPTAADGCGGSIYPDPSIPGEQNA